jgi:hypothetical protein
MQRAFASWLRRHPDDGRFILSNGYDWTYLTVEGPAFFVQSVLAAQADRPQLQLLDGRILPLQAPDLRCDAAGRLWLRLPEGEQACFTGAAQRALEPWLTEQEGRVGLQIAGQFSPIEGS